MDYLGGWVPLKWFAFVCIACGSLMHFPVAMIGSAAMLWLDCLVGFASIRFARERLRSRASVSVLSRRAEVSRGAQTFIHAERSALGEPDSDADALLDKIARSGLQSLTAAEHARLEKARQDLLNKGKQ